MADTLTTNWTDFLYEMRGPLQKAYPKKTVLLAELKRDTSRENFSGNQVRVPLFTSVLQGAQGIAEAGTVTDAQVDDTSQAHITLAHQIVPVRVSPELMKQSIDNSAAKAMAAKVERALEAIVRLHNEQLNSNGDGLLCNVASSSGSAGLTIPVTNGNPRQLYEGRIVDILTRSNGANPGNGLQRKITSVTKNSDGSVATIVVNTAAFGGDSGNVTFSANEGVYIQDTYGNAAQGLQQIGGTTGTFQAINRATAGNGFWKGTDGRDGDSTSIDPNLSALDKGMLLLGQRCDADSVDFIVGDPGVILKHGQLFYSAFRYDAPVGKLESGFEGVKYRNMVMVGDYDHQLFALTGITKKSLQMYGYAPGPDWDDLTGSRMQRFARTRVVEMWLADDLQLGAHECRDTVRWTNFNRAS